MLYTRVTTFAVNMELGATATMAIGLVLTLIGYQRQVAMGLVIGLDAVVSRHYGQATNDGEDQARLLVLNSSYMQAAFAAFSVTFLWIFAEPIFRLWLGDSLVGSGWEVSQSVLLFKIMSVGIAARSVSEGWMKFLSGKGEVAAYAPALVVGGIINVLVLLWTLFYGPEGMALVLIAASYAVLHVIVQVGVIGWQVSRRLHLRITNLFFLISVPFAMAALLAFLCWGFLGDVETLSGAVLASTAVLAFGLASLAMMNWVVAKVAS